MLLQIIHPEISDLISEKENLKNDLLLYLSTADEDLNLINEFERYSDLMTASYTQKHPFEGLNKFYFVLNCVSTIGLGSIPFSMWSGISFMILFPIGVPIFLMCSYNYSRGITIMVTHFFVFFSHHRL